MTLLETLEYFLTETAADNEYHKDTSKTGTRALYRCPFLMYDALIDENSNAFQQRN